MLTVLLAESLEGVDELHREQLRHVTDGRGNAIVLRGTENEYAGAGGLDELPETLRHGVIDGG